MTIARDHRKHPSGRPKWSDDRTMGRLPVPRMPNDEPLTPGLRRGSARIEAIGFRAPRLIEEEFGDRDAERPSSLTARPHQQG
jgi:hypothetical protein